MPLTPAHFNTYLQAYLPGTLGVEIVDTNPDAIVGRLTVRKELCTAGDTLHGGAYMAFADTLGAVATVINMPKGARTTTIESKTNFFGAAPLGSTVIGTSTAFHKGRTTQVWQTKLTTESGKLLAVITQTQMILPAAT